MRQDLLPESPSLRVFGRWRRRDQVDEADRVDEPRVHDVCDGARRQIGEPVEDLVVRRLGALIEARSSGVHLEIAVQKERQARANPGREEEVEGSRLVDLGFAGNRMNRRRARPIIDTNPNRDLACEPLIVFVVLTPFVMMSAPLGKVAWAGCKLESASNMTAKV